MREQFLSTLFDPGEGVCLGDFKATKVFEKSTIDDSIYYGSTFICINPLHCSKDFGYLFKDYYSEDIPRRADINITSYRSFLFEMDSISLEDQLKVLEHSGINFTSIVYSGSKSYHAILSLEAPLKVQYHERNSSFQYKQIWHRLAAKIEQSAKALGFIGVNKLSGVIDYACQNPSRLSRIPGITRDNGKLQKLVKLGNRMNSEAFESLLQSCPKVYTTLSTNEEESSALVDSVKTSEEFWSLASTGLKNKLRYVDWASDSGMYRELYALTCWALKETGVSKDIFQEILWERTFPRLLDAGYPEQKLMIGVDHAYNYAKTKVRKDGSYNL